MSGALVTTIVFKWKHYYYIVTARVPGARIRPETKYYIITRIYTRISTAMFSQQKAYCSATWRVCVRVCMCGYAVLYGSESNARIAYNIIVFCSGRRWVTRAWEEVGNRINHKVYFTRLLTHTSSSPPNTDTVSLSHTHTNTFAFNGYKCYKSCMLPFSNNISP